MNYKLVKLSKYSGNKASVYTIKPYGEEISLFERFVEENIILHEDETKDLLGRLITIGRKTGAREQFFKLGEGALGDGVAALYDKPNSNLRLYCIRYGSLIIIIGGGGLKPKTIKALQDDPKLTSENLILRRVSQDIRNRTDEGEIKFINDGMDFDGNLDFYDELED